MHDDNAALVEAILALCCEIRSAREFSNLATKHDINELKTQINIMASIVSDFIVKQKAYNAAQAVAIDAAVQGSTAATAAITGLTADIQALTDKITELQNSPGAVTPEDAAAITQLETDGNAMLVRAEAVAKIVAENGAALKALDEKNPPAVPQG